MRYKVWRSRDNLVHVMCFDERFEELPDRIRHLGPWVGARSGAVENLKLHYRCSSPSRASFVICSKPSALRLEPR